MGTILDEAQVVYVDGPSGSPTHPPKPDVRHLFATVDTRVEAALSGAGEIVGTWDASSGTFPGSGTADTGAAYLVTVAGTTGGVAFRVGDRIVSITTNSSTTTYAGNWLRLAGNLDPIVNATDSGAGSANAIQVVASKPVSSSGGQLVSFEAFEANTSTTVTLQITDSTAAVITGLAVKTASGNDPAIGALSAGLAVLGQVDGSTFRLISDLAGSAIQAAAEAAAATATTKAAEAAASAASAALVAGALPRVNKAALKALDTTAITIAYRSDAGAQGFFEWKAGDYADRIAADANEYQYVKADAIAATSGSWVRVRMGAPLDNVSVSRLPMGAIALPGTFNNPLNASAYWDGATVRFNRKPYDIIDFTLYEACNHYYVDYALGDNVNAGTSPGAGNAWKTFDYARANAVSPAVIHLKDEWVGYLSAGSSTGVSFSGKFKIIGEGPSGRTRFVSMRENYDAAHFGFVASGANGAYVSTAPDSGDVYRAQFDSNYKDNRGIPAPIVAAASQAACESASGAGTYYWDAATTTLYVHMIDNRIPDPADGWIYARSAYRQEWQQALDTTSGVILGENLEFCANTGTATNAAFRYRPVTTGAATTAQMGLKNCLAYGSAGNGFEIYDADVVVMENCFARYNHIDGFNYHSFITSGTDGEYITVYEYDCGALDSGYNLFSDQAALSTSANGSSSHDSMHILRVNGVYADCNGAIIADVNGVHSLNYNVQAGSPKGTASPKACFWHESFNGAGTTKKMFLWGCSAFDGGDGTISIIDNTAQGGGATGDIHVQHWLGQTDGKIVGALKDFSGATL